MLAVVTVLIFLLGWPFEWPAVILVFLPIFYPVVSALGIDLVWFGALVAVTLQTAYLSPPVAMSAYYLKQVVKDLVAGPIYKGMFEFMGIQGSSSCFRPSPPGCLTICSAAAHWW